MVSSNGKFADVSPTTETFSNTWFSVGPRQEHYVKCRVSDGAKLFLQVNNPRQSLLALGPGKLADFQHIDARRLPEGLEVTQDCLLAKDHVYLMYHRTHRNSWLLFQAESLSAP